MPAHRPASRDLAWYLRAFTNAHQGGGALGIGGGGSGGGGSLFSARGAGNALTRTTAYLAVAFFCTSIALTVIATQRGGGSVIDNVAPPAATGAQPAPAEGSGTGGSVLPQLAPAPTTPQVPVNQ